MRRTNVLSPPKQLSGVCGYVQLGHYRSLRIGAEHGVQLDNNHWVYPEDPEMPEKHGCGAATHRRRTLLCTCAAPVLSGSLDWRAPQSQYGLAL
jgi:hypothetical protein